MKKSLFPTCMILSTSALLLASSMNCFATDPGAVRSDDERFEVSLKYSGGALGVGSRKHVLSLDQAGTVISDHTINYTSWHEKRRIPRDAIAGLQYAIGNANVGALRDRYSTEEEGCRPSFSEGGWVSVSVAMGQLAKEISIYGRCHYGVGPEAQAQIDQVWRLIKTFELFLDTSDWRSARDAVWARRVAEVRERNRVGERNRASAAGVQPTPGP